MDHNQLVSIFEEEFLPQLEALYAFAYHLTRNQTDAEDLVQDTYLKAQRFIAGYEQGTNAKAWLFRILKNTFLNKYRSQTKKGTRIEFEEELGYQTEELAHTPDQYFDLRQAIFENMLGDEISTAMDQLPEDYKTIIVLSDLEDFTYEEMAQILEIPLGTVRSRLFRARNALKKLLYEYAKEQGYEDHRSWFTQQKALNLMLEF